jgi:hypothetical protein
MRIDWILGQLFFWILVMAIILSGVLGIRRAGGVLAAQQSGLAAARDPWGVEPGGMKQAGLELATWWGLKPAQTGDAARVVDDPGRRSVVVRLRGAMHVLFGGEADLGAGSFQRVEDLYLGPPTKEGWE